MSPSFGNLSSGYIRREGRHSNFTWDIILSSLCIALRGEGHGDDWEVLVMFLRRSALNLDNTMTGSSENKVLKVENFRI